MSTCVSLTSKDDVVVAEHVADDEKIEFDDAAIEAQAAIDDVIEGELGDEEENELHDDDMGHNIGGETMEEDLPSKDECEDWVHYGY